MAEKRLKLRASARDNRRYLLIAEEDNSRIEKAILDYIGVLGMAKSAYMRVDTGKGKTIGAVRREEIDRVRAALGFYGIKISKVSGTLKGLKG